MKVIISFGAKGWWVRAKVSNSDLAQDQGPQASWVFFCLFVFGFLRPSPPKKASSCLCLQSTRIKGMRYQSLGGFL